MFVRPPPDRAMAQLPDPARIQSKGFTLHSALAYVEQRHGTDGRERLLERLDAEAREVLAGRVLASAWYPFRVQVACYESIDNLWGRGDFALCWQIGRFTAQHEATTIHKVFLKLGGLERWLRVAGTLWSRYYSAGRLELGERGDRAVDMLVRDFNPISRAFCHDLGGWFWRTAEMSGVRGVEVRHQTCLLAGDDACRYHATWV